MSIHNLSIIEDGAKIGKNVVIEPYAFISKEAVIEDNAIIMQGAQIRNKTTIGENTKIFPYAMVGTYPQDLKFTPGDDTSLIIGKNCTIREFATINIGTLTGSEITKIGDNVLVMNYVHIAHDCIVGNNVILVNNVTLAGHVEVGDFSVIGGLTPVHQFVKIGEGCMIAGGSALAQDVPHYCLAEGNRAVVRSLNLTGLRRRFEKSDIDALKVAFNVLFRNKNALKDNAEKLLQTSENEKVKKMCEFVMNTQRGIAYERIK